MIKKMIKVLVIVLVTFTVTLCAFGESQATGNLPIVIGWQPSPEFVFYIAKEKGLFEKAGLEPKFVKFTAGPPFMAAIRSGDIDVGFMGFPPLIYGMAADLNFKIIYIIEHSSAGHGLVVKKNSSIKSFKDQEGKKIGYFFGSTSHLGVLESFKQNGVDPKKVTQIHLTPTAGIAALASGDIDGFFCWPPWSFVAIEKADGRFVGTMSDLNLYAGCAFFARTEFLNEHPETIQRFFKALDLADKFLFGGSVEKTAKLIAPVFGTSLKTSVAIVKSIHSVKMANQIKGDDLSLGTYADRKESPLSKKLDTISQFFFDLEKIKTKPDTASFIDSRPVQEYLSKRGTQ